MQITIETRGRDPKQIMLQVSEAIETIKQNLEDLARDTVNIMRGNIIPRRQPATGDLANSIDKENISENGEYIIGIGNISKLPTYWYVVNYGKKFKSDEDFIPGGGKPVRGDFDGQPPLSRYRGVPGGAGVRMTYPGAFKVRATFMPAMNYIEKTVDFLDTGWNQYFRGIKII
jgi:hypothetical protein